jgi:hypothetical protein
MVTKIPEIYLRQNFIVLDAEIRATLNSYQYLKKLLIEKLDRHARLEPMIFVCIFLFKWIASIDLFW